MSDTVTTGSSTTGVQDRASEVAGTAREQASEVAGTAKEQAASVASTAGEQARVVVTDAKQQARRLVDDGRRQVREQAGQQTARAASSLRGLGDQLQRMASGQGSPEGPAADIARQAAGTVQRLADSLQNRSPEQLLADTRRFARQRPGVFVLGALGAGFLAGRLLRAATDDDDTGVSSQGYARPDGLVSGPGAIDPLGSPAYSGGLVAEVVVTDVVDMPADLTGSSVLPPATETLPGTGPSTGMGR
jgi:hypothetical protein